MTFFERRCKKKKYISRRPIFKDHSAAKPIKMPLLFCVEECYGKRCRRRCCCKAKKKIHKCLKRGSIFLRVHLSGPYHPSLRPILFLMDHFFQFVYISFFMQIGRKSFVKRGFFCLQKRPFDPNACLISLSTQQYYSRG